VLSEVKRRSPAHAARRAKICDCRVTRAASGRAKCGRAARPTSPGPGARLRLTGLTVAKGTGRPKTQMRRWECPLRLRSLPNWCGAANSRNGASSGRGAMQVGQLSAVGCTAPLKVNFDHDTIRRSVTTSGNRGTARRSSASPCPKQQANGPWPASLHRKVPDMPHSVSEAPPD
jgi:hypothetical protein